jgi:hypothetical protein
MTKDQLIAKQQLQIEEYKEMLKKNTEIQAFTSSNSPDTGFYSECMTLRDWFAGMALKGMLSNPATELFSDGKRVHSEEAYAIASYRVSDAMLSERDNTNN